ncbi:MULTISPECIES: helix-turn-helix domain-containing protein [unclassified Micromonospora]|uniref:helix-turn-helix domain-containing protein n=1 Tax=unclassified Micromonospora TaxID=2617518 RepID=UPI0010332FDD|nr:MULTISPECIES: helix-turn-helix domain-containing protein [unclassified Micromonospora]QKW14194.1 helix-turn-helix domain-containing protein [Verrucosispora sp. NA02020]TBL31441.1 helix-turn-helix domain-containing protein [Verrucosispora sp. SN26_14.1]
MLVLDTGDLPAGERAEAFQATVSANCSSSMASFEDPAAIHARMTVFDFGPAKVFNIEASGTTLRRTPRMCRAETETSIVLAVPLRTDNHLSWAREDRRFGPRDLMLVDLSLPYVYGWEGGGASYALHVDVDRLGVPRDLIHEAARTLPGSPMYDLVRDHVTRMTTQADPLAASAAAAELGAASVELMRALVVSAAGSGRLLRDTVESSMSARIQAYVRAHLREPDLTPARVAAANAISLRALYKLYEEMGQSLEQSIIEQRLQGARAELTASHRRYTSIAALARAWGFSSPSFFSHRFRAAFGLTPRQLAATRPTTRTPEPARSR